jgi:HSP20 family protein
MMHALVPRVFSDVEDWVGTELAGLGMRAIRVEDYRDGDDYVLRAELPGIDPERDVKVNVDRGVLTLEAERTEEKRDHQRTEFRYGAARRSVALPAAADEEHITARYDNGMLEVRVPLRKPESEGRQVPIERAH